VRIALVAAATVVVAAVPGAGAQTPEMLRIESISTPVISPNGNGVRDSLTVKTNASSGALLGLRVYAWGGRLSGWKRIRTGVSSTTGELTWNGASATGRLLGDGTYQVTVCYKDPGSLLPPRGVLRPGAAEASVRRPPWRTTGCAETPQVVRVERLALFVDSTGSFHQGERVPLVESADRGQVAISLERDCTAPAEEQMIASDDGNIRIPLSSPPGLYHAVAGDPAGDQFRAPIVVRSPMPLDGRSGAPRSSSGRT
jgi:hypothetical protein